MSLPFAGDKRLTKISLSTAADELNDANQAALIDPRDGLDKLPVYFLGGENTTGFKTMLGNALALLYVARHGLKESELWSMLATIQIEIEQSISVESKAFNSEAKAITEVCFGYRELFLDMWRAEDNSLTNKLSFGRILKGMQKINSGFTAQHLRTLLISLDMKDLDVDYNDLFARIVKANKASKLKQTRSKLHSSLVFSDESTLQNDLDAPLFDESRKSDSEEETENSNPISVTGMSRIESASLGPVLEEALLSVLCSFGVLHTQNDQVLILPCESEALRSKVFTRYVTSDGHTLEEWHLKVIRFFQCKKNSLRRCEELPWHLQICKKWTSLKDIVSDLRTFELMYVGGLKDELLSYWYKLSQGPLFISDKSEQEAVSLQGHRDQLNDNANILSLIDSANVLNLTEKAVRKLFLKGKVATFDIVEELDKSVENWTLKKRPPAEKICVVIMQISNFLAEFCKTFDISNPPFLRKGMDPKLFETFSIVLDLGESSNDDKNEMKKAQEELNKKHADAGIQGSVIYAQNLYLYLRWMWIQFPWLSMQPKFAMRYANQLMNVTDRQRKQELNTVGNIARDDIQIIEGIDSQSMSLSSSNKIDQNLLAAKEKSKRSFMLRKGKERVVADDQIEKVSKNTAASVAALDAMHTVGRSILLGTEKHKVKDRFRCTIEEHLKNSENIPFSQPSKRALSHNTLFPSVDMAIKEKQATDLNSMDKLTKVIK